MNLDRNTIIGFVLLALLLFVYLFVSTKNSKDLQVAQKQVEDSVKNVKRIADSIRLANDTSNKIKPVIDSSAPGFRKVGAEQLVVVENELIKVTFTNKGGQPKKVELKNYKTEKGQQVQLGGKDFDKFSYNINTGNNSAAAVSDIYFNGSAPVKNADGSQVLTFTAAGTSGEVISHSFTIRPNDYLLDWNISFNGADRLLQQGAFNFVWQSQPHQAEEDVNYERQQTNICFEEGSEFDYIQTKSEKKFESAVNWISVSQQFFNTTLVAKNSFAGGDIKFIRNSNDSASAIGDITSTLQTKLPLGAVSNFPMQLYYGPNDFKILSKQPVKDMDKIINLGRDMYAFVRPINRYIVMPVFDFFKNFFASFGLVIALLTIFIRLATSPLVYTSYLSGAKMKALRPEIDKLKEKFGADQQSFGMEQMKLFREAGVNPLGGCIPALLQIPIFFALYSFFNSNIALRGESFLWAHNLASYDVIVKFPISVWGLGSHLSLFTLTAAATSFLISLYNANMTPDQNNPALKYMPYIFPFILLFIFNRLPSALTWYYTVSNVITLILQFVIQNYIIDHDKILAKIEANRKKPKTKSKWAEKLEEMQEQQKKAQQGKGGRK